MGWLKLDDNVSHHPKMLAAGAAACWLWICGLSYCQRRSTDGVVPKSVLPFLGCAAWKPSVIKLLGAGLWIEEGDAYRVHDFLQWNDSASERQFKAESNRRRLELFRDADLREYVKNRDGGRCRYCGVVVKWNDRRGPHGGTYDHVDPSIGNTVENLVVCCRGCNSSKQRRTPVEAGMDLRQIQDELKTSQNGSRSDLPPPPPTPTPLPQPTPQPTSAKNADVRVSGGALIRSSADYEKALKTNVFAGARLDVPHKIHGDFCRRLGGVEPDSRLRAWYLELDEELERTGEGVLPDVWKWLELRFKDWAVSTTVDPEWAKIEAWAKEGA